MICTIISLELYLTLKLHFSENFQLSEKFYVSSLVPLKEETPWRRGDEFINERKKCHSNKIHPLKKLSKKLFIFHKGKGRNMVFKIQMIYLKLIFGAKSKRLKLKDSVFIKKLYKEAFFVELIETNKILLVIIFFKFLAQLQKPHFPSSNLLKTSLSNLFTSKGLSKAQRKFQKVFYPNKSPKLKKEKIWTV